MPTRGRTGVCILGAPMRITVLSIIILGSFLIGKLSFCETSPDSIQAIEQAFLETDAAYRRLYPTAPLSIPGTDSNDSNESGPEFTELKEKILNKDTACHFYPDDITDETVVPSARIKILKKSETDYLANAKELLNKCNEIKRDLGNGACSAIEFNAHASGYSIGVGKFIGFRVTAGQWEVFPENPQIMKKVVACLKDISKPDATIVFASCGGALNKKDYGYECVKEKVLFYPYKKEAQDLIADLLDRTVISARGPSGEEIGTAVFSRYGWYRAEPTPRSKNLKAQDLPRHLPRVKPGFRYGIPTHTPEYPIGYDEKTESFTSD